MNWRLGDDGQEIPPPGGADATVWIWTVVSEDWAQERSVQVWISGTAMSSSDVHFRVDDARRSKGQTELHRVLDWEEPPAKIEFHSESTEPLIEGGEPGPDVRELTEIADWFGDRGILIVFTARGVGTRPSVATWTHSANLINPEVDELVGRYEAPTRLEAARKARESWQDTDTPPSSSEAAPSPALKARIDTAEVGRLRQHGIHLVWSAPDEDEPDSGWMLEAYDDHANLLDIAVQKEATDALLTIVESLLPREQ